MRIKPKLSKKRKWNLYIAIILIGNIIFCILQFSCSNTNYPDNVESALTHTRENRKELVKALKKYSRRKKDSLKYKSVCFLIENMPDHYGEYHKDINSKDAVYENIVRSLMHMPDTVFMDDSFNMVENNAYIKYDINTITADFLIDNIEKSFYAWENYPWCKDMNFEDFKEFILPYRIGYEPLFQLKGFFQDNLNWLVDSMKGRNDIKLAFEFINDYFYYLPDLQSGWGYKKVQDLYDFIRLNNGLCEHETWLKNCIFRSMGIKSLFDEVTQWANRSANHHWNAYPDTSGKPLIIKDVGLDLEYSKILHSADMSIKPPGDKFISDKINVTLQKTAAKVYRKTYTINKNSIVYQNITDEIIPDNINDLHAIDVTSEYMECYNIEIPLPEYIKKEFAYICVFSQKKIVPVFWGKINNHRVKFTDMGANVLYIVTFFENNKLIPVTLPFILDTVGNLKQINKSEVTETVTLYRKYPLFGNILNYANKMYLGTFQGSNYADFSNVDNLYQITSTYLLPTSVSIKNNTKYRYLRFLSDSASSGDIGEIAFYYDSNGVAKKISGKPICKHPGQYDRHYTFAFDNNEETFYSCNINNTWIGLDLGENNEKSVIKIKFSPRTDTDYIMPGKEYELYYWDYNWVSLGRKIAKKHKLVYNNVPKKVLLWLKCHSGGREERPFIFENGKQVWW